jgi:uncharacterized membrane protein YkvA (DUF1232 family)
MIGAKQGAFAGGSRLVQRDTLDRARLTWRLLRDARVSPLRYAIPAMVLAYLASPVDAVPDFLLGIGQTDDLGIAVVGFMLLIRIVPLLAPRHVVDDHARELGLVGPRRVDSRSYPNQPVEAQFRVRG